ncbi:NUDIX hydrolase [Micropruina sonneratiae]|uniref:NUDIX hydrolase n=1 Tax=Micropruina sonneratiae TaxID=2986940 RepID=UPI0022275817|nr:NUDIX hydrolase [Micropruina sp. KQZ13P-5]MCW3159245.1 NUDIX hydrolase [Micropruina sp. KQZ13P-5]
MSNVASLVSVDVITLRYNPNRRRVEVATKPRTTEPYLDRPALPGVLLREGERLAAAAHRAVTSKVGFDVDALGQLTVFDQPNRDPRGYSLSVAMWAVGDGDADWYGYDEVPKLAFDHNVMLFECRALLVDMLWRDLEFTRALTGPVFPVSAAVGITQTLSGVAPDRGNLNRRLASLRGLTVSSKRVVLGRGRPGTVWEWDASAA